METSKIANYWVLGFTNNKPNGNVHAFNSEEDALYFTGLNNNGLNNVMFLMSNDFKTLINYCGVCNINMKPYLFQ